MLIHVLYKDNRYDYVKGFMLDALIATERVVRFRRSSGWVIIGRDPVRKRADNKPFAGVERRAAIISKYPIDIRLTSLRGA